MDVFCGFIIPFLGTSLGAAMVLFMKSKISCKVEKMLLGFASGVMVAASVWSLIIPAIEMSKSQNVIAWVPATIGLLLGVFVLLAIDIIISRFHIEDDKPKDKNTKFKKTCMMALAVTLHNIPEGMAVGVLFAGALTQNSGVTMAGAFALAIGIAIQNLPEGAIISMPLKSQGLSKTKSFLYGVLSGVVEPIGAVITLVITSAITVALPYLLSFAAGAMVFVVVKELVPESQSGAHSNIGVIGFAIGFTLMMILDVALG